MPALGEAVVFYDFNDASNSDVAVDITGNGNNGEVLDAEYTADKGGRTGAAGDRAMDFGDFNNDAYVDIITAADGAFDSLTENDMTTLTMWIFGNDEQPVDQWTFYAGPYRQLGSHIPWSNSNVYFDVAGTEDSACCTDRINTPIDLDTFSEEWNHYAFVKNEDETFIYQNGELLIEGFDMRPLNEITEFFVGVGPEGDRRSYAGLIDDFGVFNTALDEAEINDIMMNGFSGGGGGITGDFDNNGALELADINALTTASASGANDPAFDLTGDAIVNADDVTKWVKDTTIGNSWIGDANFDGEFNSSDFVAVFQGGLFETGNPANWSLGDWNGDGVFGSGDFVAAFQDGGFELGPRGAALNAVPEPSSLVLAFLGIFAFVSQRRKRA
jgi:hypothetical protein